MATGTIVLKESASSGGRLAAKIEWSATADPSTNSSKNVTAYIYVRKYDPSQTLTIQTTGTWSFNLNINGSNISGTTYASVLLDWVLIGTHKVSSIDHDGDGSKSITISGSVSGPSGTGFAGHTTSGSGTATFDRIPRQAKITAAYDFTDVGNPSISFSNPGGYRMDVWLEPNPVGDHLCIRENIPSFPTGSFTWSLTDAEREALRSRCSGDSCTIRIGLYSYVGGVQYADYRDMTYTMTENAATRPVVSLSVSPNNGSLPSAFNGLYIQGKSRVNVAVSATGKYNAKINSYSGNVDGKSYSGDKFTSDALQNPGTVSIYGYAVDSRGFTGSNGQQIQVIEYAKPLVIPIGGENAILCYRSDGNGKRTGSSTSVWIKAARSYHKVIASGSQKNFCALQWRRKLSTEAWNDSVHQWSDLIAKSSLATDEYSGLLSGVVFDLQKSYTIQIRAIDDIGEHDPKTLEVPTRDVALHLGKGGKNVSVGSYCDYSEDYTFYSAWKAIFANGFVDETDTGWQSISATVYYRCKCGYVTIVGVSGGQVMLNSNDTTPLGTIPEQFAPDISIPFVCHFIGGSPVNQSGFLRENGNIELYVSGSGTSYWAFAVTYPI